MVCALIAIKNALARFLEWLVIVGMAVLVLAVVWQVVSRKVLGMPSSWSEELARMVLVWISLLGASVAYARKAHLGVDYAVGKLDHRSQAMVALLVHVLVGVFAAAVLVYGGWIIVERTLAVRQSLPALGIQMGYVYLALPLSGVFFILFAAEGIVECLSQWRAPLPREE